MYSERIWNAEEAALRHCGEVWTERHSSDASMTEQTVLDMSSRTCRVSRGDKGATLSRELRIVRRKSLQFRMASLAKVKKSFGWWRFGSEKRPLILLLLMLLLLLFDDVVDKH